MKNKYIKPIVELVVIEEENLAIGSQESHDIPSPSGNHCSACRWNFDGTEAWHCTHTINNWTGKPFNPDCDFYD